MRPVPPPVLALLSIVLCATSGLPGLLLPRRHVRSGLTQRIATGMMLLGAGGGIAAAVTELMFPGWRPLSLPWALPFGDFSIAVDGLSAIFLFPVFLIPALGSIYGLSYYSAAAYPRAAVRLPLFYGLLCAAMALLCCARSTVVFLFGWEAMALSAFFLVTTEDEQPHVREAGWVYLVATHIGTLCLLALFALLHAATGSFSFIHVPRGAPPALLTALFVLSLVGFGMKAGLMPLHVWLPGAHANAPSHVSAALSGVMIKMGIYGLLRMLSLFPEPPVYFGEVLLLLGVLSGVLGMAFALAQHDIKRMLAYCSIENIGIITIGLGLAMLGRSLGRVTWVVLGLSGAVLHVLNHALFKSLLFFSAGSVIHATQTREIDLLGGLFRTMPRTALCFLGGAVAICGLPPLNGFVGELCVYLGLFHAAVDGEGLPWVCAIFAAPALALTGALSAACFVKVTGAVFLGSPRSPRTAHAHEAPTLMLLPMTALLLLCLGIGLLPLCVLPLLLRALSSFAPGLVLQGSTFLLLAPLHWLTGMGVLLLLIVAPLALFLKQRVRAGRPATTTPLPTWDCGYAAPAATMQYTASSLSQMLVDLFAWALRPRTVEVAARHLFPREAHFHRQVPDTVLDRAIVPSFQFAASTMARLRFLQQGNLHMYLLYIFVTLIALLGW